MYIDNLESLQFTTPDGERHPAPDEGYIVPSDLRDFLATVLALGDKRGLSLVITTRVPLPFGKNPLFFDSLHSRATKLLRLDKGLPLQDGIALMQAMKHHDNLPDADQLAVWHAKVNGFPRGLQALVGYLNQSQTRHIQDLLDDPQLFGENVLSEIVGKVIDTLSTPLKQVLGAVALIGQATTQADLEYALAPHLNIAYLRRTGTAGKVTAPDGGYQIAGERYIPDVAYSKDPTSTKGYNPIAPDLIVEVISDPSSAQERANLHIKTANYLAVGCVVWIINPESQSVEVYAPNTPVQIIPTTGTLRGGDVLPDFAVNVADLFPQK